MAEGLSGWECLKCGELNDHSYTECEDCGLTKDVAVRYIVQKRRKTCKECDHLHNELTYCHVYVEEGEKKEDGAGEDDDEGGEGENGEEDGEEEEEDDDDDDDDKDDDVLGVKEEKEEKLNFSNNKEEKKMVPLPTPAFVKNIKFIRCNCKVGVRNRSKFYEKFPQGGLYCENIQILTYEDITDPDKVERRKEKKRREREEMGGEEGEQKRKMDEIGVLLPLVLRFMHVGQCWVTAVAAKAWMTGTNNFRDYTDVRDMIPWKVCYMIFILYYIYICYIYYMLYDIYIILYILYVIYTICYIYYYTLCCISYVVYYMLYIIYQIYYMYVIYIHIYYEY